MHQELDVLTALVDAWQASKKEEQKHHNDDRRKRRDTFIQSYWRQLFVRKELQRLKKAKTLSLIPVNDSRMNHLEERGNDTIRAIKKQSDSNSDVKCTTSRFTTTIIILNPTD
jgi:hypothetical protein